MPAIPTQLGASMLHLCISITLLVLAVASLLAVPANADIQLDNTCPHGNNYIQLAGFACIAADERIRNPSWDGTWATQGRYNIMAYTLINKNMNRLGITMGNTTYCANFTIVHSGCSGSTAPGSFPMTVSQTWAAKSDFLIADYGSTLALPNILAAEAAKKVIFVPVSSSSIVFRCRDTWMAQGLQPQCAKAGDKRFPHAFSMLVPADTAMNPVITMFKLSGVGSIVLWNENQTFPNTVAEGVMSFAAYNGIPVTQLTVPPTPTQDDINNLVGQIKELAPEGVIGAAYAPACPKVVKAMKSLNYMPKGWAQTECISEPATKSTTPDAIYGIDKSEFDRRMTGPHWTDDFWYPPSADGTPSPELVYRDLVNTFNEVPQGFIACTMGAGLVLHKVLEKVGTIQTSEVLTGIQLFNEPSFMGQIGFSAWGQNNVKDVIVFQADKSFDLQIIYPLGSATSNYLFPAPTFDERVFQGGYMNKASEIALAAVTGFFILISLGLTVWLIIFRNHRVLTAASPLFLGTILFGSLLLYSTVYAWVLNASTVACYLRFWLLGVGFVVMFGALFAKTYRIMRIFTTTDLRVFKITNLQLILVLLILVGVEVMLLAIWSATSRPVRTLHITDPIRPSKDVWVCSTGKSGKVMLGILVAYKLCIVLFGIYMSIRIWKIPLKQFNESRAIAFSMYNMLCFGILAFGLQVSGAISDPAMYIVRSVCLILSTFFTLAAIFGPKVVAVITGHTGYSSKSNSGGTTNGTRGHLETLGSNGTNGTKEGKESYYGSAYEPSSPEKAEANSKPSVEEALDELKKKYAKLKKKYNALIKAEGGNKAKDEADSGSLLSDTASSPPSSPAVAPKSPSNRKNTRSNSK